MVGLKVLSEATRLKTHSSRFSRFQYSDSVFWKIAVSLSN